MKQEFDKLQSISFKEYLKKMNILKIEIDNDKRILIIVDGKDNSLSKIYLSAQITHHLDLNELLDFSASRVNKDYYIFENGTKGYDWLWYYDIQSIENLFD